MDDNNSADRTSPYRKLPQVERLSKTLPDGVPSPVRVDAARRAIAAGSDSIRQGDEAPDFETLAGLAANFVEQARRRRLIPVINATGVLLHTNLGRAPLSPAALAAVDTLGGAYSNLEYDLEATGRGSRYEHAAELIRSLTGAESALVVNNNAAAVLLALAGLARGKEAIVSRGELIEIGGEFRIPDIMAESGVVMREVGTTNRTHLKDYRAAIGAETAAIMKVHPSNYQITGFTKEVTAAELSGLGKSRGVPVIYDLGSGLLRSRIGGVRPSWLSSEPTVEGALAAGADLITFSGDKLLGGPQAGILAGSKDIIDRLRRSPLLRAFRVDKMTLAALQATLLHYLDNKESDLPLWRMALTETAVIQSRAEGLLRSAGDVDATITLSEGYSTLGGGSAPGSRIPTKLIQVSPNAKSSSEVIQNLVTNDPPVIGRIENEAVFLDLRTVEPAEDQAVAEALVSALR